MPRLTSEQLGMARAAKRERIKRSLVAGLLGDDREIIAAVDEIDAVFVALIESALWHWFTELLPKHFGPGASVKYGYAPRRQGYLFAKFRGRLQGDRFHFPSSVALRMASYQRPGSGPAADPFPLELSGRTKTTVTNAPARGPIVRATAKGYVGEMTIALPAFIKRADIQALLRDTERDLQEMVGIVQAGLQEVFGNA
jgi:hypothetical protein